MSIFDRFFGRDKADDDGPKPEISLASETELAAIEGGTVRSVVLASGERGAAFADALVPVAANAAQAAQTYGMAVVKFPEGVGWADLCVRRSDGWNLLSNFKDGKFNEMAAIRQAGLQPVAVANLALQGAAVLVGQAYMAQINDKLEGLSDGIAEIQRSMESGREAELESHFDALERVVLMFDEHGSDQSKRTVALQVVENATRAAQRACHYEAKALRGIGASVGRRGKMSKGDVERLIQRLRKEEDHASIAFQLLVAARQTGMRLESDYTNARIEKELSIMRKAADELTGARGSARELIGKRISGLRGVPFALAEPIETEGAKGAAVVLDRVAKAVSRINPARAHQAAKDRLASEKADLRDGMGSDNTVKALAEKNEEDLENLRFAFNEADVIVIDNGVIKAVSSKLPAGEMNGGETKEKKSR